jgi:hypothetical protein
LAVAGWWGRRPGLLLVALAFVAAALGVIALRRRYLARLDEIERARAALRRDAAALARSLRGDR